MNFIESFFMVGILTGYFIFSAFVDDGNPQSTAWLSVYYLLAGIAGIAFLLQVPRHKSCSAHNCLKNGATLFA